MAAEVNAIIFYRCNVFLFYFVSINFGALPPDLGHKNIKFCTTFSATCAFDTAYLQNETSYQQTKMIMSICYLAPTS